MLKRFAGLLCVLGLTAIGVSAQGLDTKATKDDWEEVNFEYSSSVLVDGYPSLLRLSELLQKNPGYKVKLEGHTDRIGNDQYNDKLGLARANTVRDFLVKYGARAGQIEVGTRGKVDPKYPGQKPTYSRTDEARWMNRRVVVTVTDDQGRTVSAAGVGEAIRAIEPPKPMQDCCSEVLKRLDKLDDITKMLRDLADQNAQLRRDLDNLKQAQQVLESKANQPVPTPPAPPSADDVAQAVAKNLDQHKDPKFQLLGANVGVDGNGHTTATGSGRFFGTFAEHYAVQAQAEYLYFHDQQEGQFDVGLVDRIGRFQAGLFSSFKHVTLSGSQLTPTAVSIPSGTSLVGLNGVAPSTPSGGGTLGQAAITLDYIFKWGKVGIFGTYGFINNPVISSQAAILPNGVVSPDLITQTYLAIVNQGGVSFSAGLWGKNYLEGNAGYLRNPVYGDRFGGTLRFVFPINNRIAFTVEGDVNPTMVGPSNDGRAVFGVLFGNSLRPREFLEQTRPVPADVPRIRYAVATRNVLKGHSPPVADAGPNQIGVPSGPITLNASASYSPDGLPIKFQWVQDGGPAVTLTNPTNAITTFAAATNTSYIFRVIVTDSLGGSSQARAYVTTSGTGGLQVLFFIANPTAINAGQASTLSWNVQGATSVVISGIGTVAASGSAPVSPSVTTTYTLTASNAQASQTATATVVVNTPQTSVTYCYASPTNIIQGESSTIYWATTNATGVSINQNVGAVGLNGNTVVSPTTNTTYTITATGAGPNGATTASCSVAVNVTTGAQPQIIRFSAIPGSISAGQKSTLIWVVQNATTVSITSLGNVSLGGSQDVSPTATTTYTLTATNAAGSVTSQATVTVTGAPVQITSFTASPNPSPSAGSPVQLNCQATNATSVNLAGQNFNGTSATATVNPTATTTYTCIATGAGGQTAQASVTVTIGGTSGGNSNPTIVLAGGNSINTFNRFITLDASGSFSPTGNTPLTFIWTSLNDRALVLNANSSTTQVQLGTEQGAYIFQLTVIDSKGNQSTTYITVNFTI